MADNEKSFKNQLLNDIDARSYELRMMLENRTQSLKFQVKDVLKEATHYMKKSNDINESYVLQKDNQFPNQTNLVPLKDENNHHHNYNQNHSGGIGGSGDDTNKTTMNNNHNNTKKDYTNYIQFHPTNDLYIGNIQLLKTGLKSYDWKVAKKFDKSMVVEGMCISPATKSLYVCLCNDDDNVSCVYKMTLSGKCPVSILQIDKRLKDITYSMANNNKLYVVNYTDDCIMVGDEVDFEFKTLLKLENVWSVHAADSCGAGGSGALLAITKDLLWRIDGKDGRIIWKSKQVKNACRCSTITTTTTTDNTTVNIDNTTITELIFLTQIECNSISILSFKDGTLLKTLTSASMDAIGICNFFQTHLLLCKDDAIEMIRANDGRVVDKLQVKFQPSFVQISCNYLYVADASSPLLHIFRC